MRSNGEQNQKLPVRDTLRFALSRIKLFCGALLFVLSACGGDSGPQRIESTCLPSLNQSCSITIERGGEAIWKIEDSLPEGHEYVISLLALDDPKSLDDLRPVSYQVRSTLASAPLSEEESQLRQQILQGYVPSGQQTPTRNGNVPLPSNLRYKMINESAPEFYIPDLRDYESRKDNGERSPRYFYVRPDDRPDSVGRKVETPPALIEGQNFLLYDGSQPVSVPGSRPFSTESPEFLKLKNCFENELQSAFRLAGEPISVDGYSGIRILLSSIQSSQGISLGAFNFYDRFLTFKGEEIEDSNFTQLLYLNPNTSLADPCSTTIHEYQHLRNFDEKVLKNIPLRDRTELQSIEKYKLRRENYGLDEGYSHFFESLFRDDGISLSQMKAFLENPNESTRSLEFTWNKTREVSIARGFNTLILMHALARVGGQLHHSDTLTQNLFKRLLESNSVGLENIASFFGEKEDAFMKNFITQMIVSVFDPSKQNLFIPSIGEFDGRVHGLSLSSTSSRLQGLQSWEFQPLKTQIPLLQRNYRSSLAPESLLVFRLNAPSNSRSSRDKSHSVTSELSSSPFIMTWTRIK